MIFRVKRKLGLGWTRQQVLFLYRTFAGQLLHHTQIHFSPQMCLSCRLNKLKKHHRKCHNIESSERYHYPLNGKKKGKRTQTVKNDNFPLDLKKILSMPKLFQSPKSSWRGYKFYQRTKEKRLCDFELIYNLVISVTAFYFTPL